MLLLEFEDSRGLDGAGSCGCDASELDCDTQSSDNESSQACCAMTTTVDEQSTV